MPIRKRKAFSKQRKRRPSKKLTKLEDWAKNSGWNEYFENIHSIVLEADRKAREGRIKAEKDKKTKESKIKDSK